jgi:hypothetical protein
MHKLELVEYKGFLWNVIHKLPDREDQDIAMLKEKYWADMVLRKNGLLYLVEIIEEAEILEEVTENC